MTEELKNKLDSFVKFIISKVDKKIDKNDLFEIQSNYNELIDFYSNFAIVQSEEFEKMLKDYDEYQEKISHYITQKEIDSDKIQSLMAEISINIGLKEKYIKLSEDYNILNQKYNKSITDNSEYEIKLKYNEKIIKDLQEEINKTKKENFEKFEKITILEEKIKINELKLNQLNENIGKYIRENDSLNRTNTELKNNYLEQQKEYQNKLVILERQIKHLSEANNNFVQENNEVQTQLKDFQLYTNMAKVHKTKLNPNDFLILETMSQRAEKAELEVQKLMSSIDELKNLNEELKDKMKSLEDYALLQIKHDREINTGIDAISDLKNRLFTDEERNEIDRLKSDPSELFKSLIKLKTENLELHNQLKDITIECNQQLREAKRKY